MKPRQVKYKAISKGVVHYWGTGDVNCDESYWTGPPADKNAIHLQFTGLKDKDDKEIYEGDIINQNGYISFVVFHDGCFWAMAEDKKSQMELYITCDEDIKVTGNIYDPK